MTCKGVIFDMDGVISQSLGLQSGAESAILKENGIEIAPKDIVARFNGSTDVDMFSTMFKENNINKDPQEASKEKWQKIYDQKPQVRSVAGVIDLIKNLHKAGIPMSVASGSPRHFITFVLDSLQITDYFVGYLSGTEVENGKPAPDVYEAAAKIIQQKPEDCIVIEDSLTAIKGAKQAGCKVLLYLPKPAPIPAEADFVVDDLQKVKVRDFHNLFS